MEGVLKVKMKKYIFIILFFAFFMQFVNADIISINSGGDEEIVVNPDTYIEGFFSGDVQVLSVCGNSILETPYEECDDGNTVSGDGCSSTCTSEAGEGEGEGGGGTTGGISLSVEPTEINMNLAVNTNREQIISITNTGTRTATISFSQQNLTNMVLLPEGSIQVASGETKEVNVVFIALSETGIFTGKLFVGGKVIYVSLNIKTKLLLFDSNIIVLNEDYLVPQGDKLRTSVTLIPLGEKERIDVTLNYVIKDYEDRTYLTRTETVLIENQVNFKRNFDTGILPKGQYIIGLELIYPNGVAPSSAHFEVTEKPSTLFGKIVFFLINAILIVLILIILLIVSRMIKQIRRNKRFEKEGLKNFWKRERKISKS